MKVLFAMDDSKFAAHALVMVGSRPWPVDTEFRLLSVLELGGEHDGVHDKLEEDVKKALQKQAETLMTQHPSSPVDVKVAYGRAKDVILDEAAEWGANFIVVGSHGRKGIQKLLLGSVAESILGRAPCTVEVVKMKGELPQDQP